MPKRAASRYYRMAMNAAPSSFRPAGSLPSAPLAAYDGPWNTRLAAHLLRRAGFGGSPSDIAHYAAMPMGDAVAALIRFPSTANYPEPQLTDDRAAELSLLMSVRGADKTDDAVMEARKQLRDMRRTQNVANVTWWLDRMVATPAPLQEKMTLFLHGHYATAAGTKNIYGLDIVDQNELFRRYALGNWRELTHYVARDRAMLKWLDNARSVKAHPNENFARELMELFTLGIGNYSEQDVRESARAFTGFTFAPRTGEFYFNARQHDDDSKTFLGKTGNFNGDDIIDIIFQQPAAPKLFASKLLAFFIYSDPEPELVDQVATLIRKNDFNMEPVMSTLLRSNVFYSDRAYRALVKSPVEFVVGTYQLFGITSVQPEVIGALNRMGQVPFHPPSVKGWDGGAQWLNTQTVLARENFASSLMSAPEMMQAQNWLTQGGPPTTEAATRKLSSTILQGDASASALADLAGYLDGGGTSTNTMLSGENFEERMRGAAYLTMAMPAYQLS
jgi:uncharacterized protein (DUF1800 family)